MYTYARSCVRACVRERERERESSCVCVRARTRVSVCVCVCVCVRARVSGRALEFVRVFDISCFTGYPKDGGIRPMQGREPVLSLRCGSLEL